MMESLNSYAMRLERALKKDKEYRDYNKDARHATVVLSVSFRHAKQEIRLLSNKLDPELYASPGFLSEFYPFLGDPEKRLRILVESDIEERHPIMVAARDYPDRLTIKRVPEDVVGQYPFNFMIVDRKGYRFESDRADFAAMVEFNNDHARYLVGQLEKAFDQLDSQSEPVL
ncbi:MAG: hypothetical protein OXQ29_26455 [Rhodospirillaceae bacterium]|nr:hypothetical protein [Rhodospirillaceae bacterium]